MRIPKTSRRAARLMGLLVLPVSFAVNIGFCADTPSPDDPLLDLFIKKGYVTQQEAEKVKAEADFIRTNNMANLPAPPSRWKINLGVKGMELFGDIRLRYEDRSVKDTANGEIDLQRFRYSVRAGLRGDLFDDFYYGFRLETSSNPRSSWNTFGTSSSGVQYQGPFGKSTGGINVGQAYIGWHPEDWMDFTLGKMPNPFYTTPMVWSPSINPEGAAEHFKYTVGEADFFANLGQFLYEDTNPTKASDGYFGAQGSANFYSGNGMPPLLFAWQGGVNYHATRKISFKAAPIIYYYTGRGANVNQSSSLVTPSFSDIYVGQGATGGPVGFSGYPLGYYDGFSANQTGINDLLVLEVPFELNFNLDRFHVRFFGDYAYNLEGTDRANAAYVASHAGLQTPGGFQLYGIQPISSPQTHDVKAYQVGFGIGSTNLVYGPMDGLVYGNSSRRHAWEFRTYWQHIEQYALDPNLIDSDFFEGRENMEGIYTALAYALTDNFIGTVRYGYAQRINDKLGTGGSNPDIPQMNPIDHYNLLQLDLTLRF